MYDALTMLAGSSLVIWLYLAFFHGGFWRADQRLHDAPNALPGNAPWPRISAVVPARNEQAVIARSLQTLLDQDYPGELSVLLVDDQSEDETASVGRELAARHPNGARLRVIESGDRPEGWVGKMWAVHSGVSAAGEDEARSEYLLLTDADVEHDPGNLRRLVTKAEDEGLDLVSLMVRLHCESGWERLLIPAFVYFFQQLYPFPRINDPRSRQTGAAGGCMLVRSTALQRAGGIEAVRGEIIDDCALGAALKRGGPVWVGVTEREYSFRPYEGLRDIWDMVARSAYTQLRYSRVLLLGTVIGLALIYLLPPLLVLAAPLHGDMAAAGLGALTWALMAGTFLPTLRLYRLSPLRALALPLAGFLYLLMTLDSARLHGQGRGATWKGRAGAGKLAGGSAEREAG